MYAERQMCKAGFRDAIALHHCAMFNLFFLWEERTGYGPLTLGTGIAAV